MLTLSTIIGAITALIIGAAGLWFGGKARGKSDEKKLSELASAEKEIAQNKSRAESAKVANDVKNEVSASSNSDVAGRLRNEWTRKDR